jgi:hypothetical protein
MPTTFFCLGGAIVPAGQRDDRGRMSYDRIEIAVALCCGLTFALIGWWEIVRESWSALG